MFANALREKAGECQAGFLFPKTENAVRDVDVCSDLAGMLKDYVGNRTKGFLFHTDSGKPLLQRNVLRDGLNPILARLNLKQNGKAFHCFRRFRVMRLRKNRVPRDLEKFWIDHANKDVTDNNSSSTTVKSPAISVARRRSDSSACSSRRTLTSFSPVPAGQSQGGVSFNAFKSISIPRSGQGRAVKTLPFSDCTQSCAQLRNVL
jgi:hypothetical protein